MFFTTQMGAGSRCPFQTASLIIGVPRRQRQARPPCNRPRRETFANFCATLANAGAKRGPIDTAAQRLQLGALYDMKNRAQVERLTC
jgi:hypothetical protein